METLRAGEAEIAFSQTDIAAYALEGTEMFDGKPIDNIMAISSLYPETVQIVTTAKSGIKSIEDLKGKKVSVGAPGSGAYINAMQILEIHGLSERILKGRIYLSMSRRKESKQAILTQLSSRRARLLVQLKRYPSKMIFWFCLLQMTKFKHWLKSTHTMLKIQFLVVRTKSNPR